MATVQQNRRLGAQWTVTHVVARLFSYAEAKMGIRRSRRWTQMRKDPLQAGFAELGRSTMNVCIPSCWQNDWPPFFVPAPCCSVLDKSRAVVVQPSLLNTANDTIRSAAAVGLEGSRLVVDP